MKVGAVMHDLMLFSRVDDLASRAGGSVVRVDTPAELPPDVELVIVDWAVRDDGWDTALQRVRDGGVRVILFGPHVDLEAHGAARDAGLGPMRARSALLRSIESALAG